MNVAVQRDGFESPTPRSQRARLTCNECSRRKIKCDKNIPCGTCVKRGIADFCGREDFAGIRHTPPPIQATSSGTGAADDVVRALLDRVSHLESALHDARRESTPQDLGLSQDEQPGATTSAYSELQVEPLTEAQSSPEESADVGDDAATVLEFLAWGRNKDTDFANAPEHESGPRRHQLAQDNSSPLTSLLFEGTRNAQLDVVEALLPNALHIEQLVGYHNRSLLWYHGSYSATIFSNDLTIFFEEYQANIRHEQLNLQWLALLFSILTASITCSSPSTSQDWGFAESEKPVLSLRWYEATILLLNLAKYAEVHTIYSVQAIATLTIAAHLLGQSSCQSVLLASAGRIAQSLGLHRLRSDPTRMTSEQLRKCEAGKRVFNQLCTQDWFQIPFSETYALNPRFINADMPLNCNDDMVVQQPTIPTDASYCNYRYEIAALMPQLLDAMAGCNTLFTKYEQVLKYDDKMRKLATASMPTFLSRNAPVADEWPVHVNWGRRSLTICASHKIIMIHRRFIGLSFTNTAFSFTRRTCIAASKTILREAFAASDENGPVLWIDQAFSIAAGIILTLDAFHRTTAEKEFDEHKQLVMDTIRYLKAFEHSKIATRGVQLLTVMQEQLTKSGPMETRKRARPSDDAEQHHKRRRILNLQSLIKDVSRNLGVSSPVTTSDKATTPAASEHSAENAWEAFMGLLPPQTGFDGQYLFDDFFLPAT